MFKDWIGRPSSPGSGSFHYNRAGRPRRRNSGSHGKRIELGIHPICNVPRWLAQIGAPSKVALEIIKNVTPKEDSFSCIAERVLLLTITYILRKYSSMQQFGTINIRGTANGIFWASMTSLLLTIAPIKNKSLFSNHVKDALWRRSPRQYCSYWDPFRWALMTYSCQSLRIKNG